MKRIALFPGSFDPFTIGHEDIVRRSLSLFDEIVIAIGANSTKTDYFPLESKIKLIEQVFINEPKISVKSYSGLTVNFCKQIGANYIVRGLRTSADFEYERAIAQVNKVMNVDVETIFILTAPEYSGITSTLVREVIRHGGEADKFLPKGIDIKNFKL